MVTFSRLRERQPFLVQNLEPTRLLVRVDMFESISLRLCVVRDTAITWQSVFGSVQVTRRARTRSLCGGLSWLQDIVSIVNEGLRLVCDIIQNKQLDQRTPCYCQGGIAFIL
jgi:hypothetical protein